MPIRSFLLNVGYRGGCPSVSSPLFSQPRRRTPPTSPMDLSPSKPPPFIDIGTVGVAQRCLVRSRIPTLSVQPLDIEGVARRCPLLSSLSHDSERHQRLSPSKPLALIDIGTVGVAQRCLVRSPIPTLSVQLSGPSASVNIGTVGFPSGALFDLAL